MVIHVKDAETDALVRELARKRGIGITAAIKEAVETALIEENSATGETAKALRERLQPLFDSVDTYARTGRTADKGFFDEMWGQGDD